MNPLSPSPAAPPLGTGNDNTLLSSGARLSETDSSTNNSSHNSLHRNTVNRFSAFATNHFKKMGMSTEFLAASLGANLNETSKATSPSNPTPTSANSYSSGNGPDQWESFVRSRSSYSFALLNTLGTDGKTATKLSVDSNTKPSPLKQSTSAKNINSPVQEPEDGFLKDIESKGFAGIWNHPITR